MAVAVVRAAARPVVLTPKTDITVPTTVGVLIGIALGTLSTVTQSFILFLRFTVLPF